MQVAVLSIDKDFHPELENLGFGWKYSFSGTGKLITALNFGILFHFWVNYEAVPQSAYFDKSLKGGVLAKHYQFVTETSALWDMNNPSQDCVHRLREFSIELVIDLLKKKDNKNLADTIEQLRDLPLNNEQLMKSLIYNFKLCLVLIRVIENQTSVERIQDDREQLAVLPVVLSVETDVVSVLVHKEMANPPSVLGFPYLMAYNDEMNQLVSKLRSANVQPPLPLLEKDDAYQLAKYNVVAGLSNFVSEVLTEGVPTALKDQYSELQEIISSFQSLHSVSSERLAYSEDLQVVSGLSSRPHSIQSCSNFSPEVSEKLSCGHQFHQQCLRRCLQEEWGKVQRSEKPVLHCPKCNVPIVDNALETVDSDLLRRLQHSRIGFRNALLRH